MMRPSALLTLFAALAAALPLTSASIFLPGTSLRSLSTSPTGLHRSSSSDDAAFHRRRTLQRSLTNLSSLKSSNSILAMAIPGNSVAEQVVIGGFGNFIAIYNSVITARILLSWFPAAQGVGFLQPVFQITDPYLNLFRGIIPPVFGLDLSPILAFVTLNLLQSSAVSLAAEVPEEMKLRMEKSGGSSRWGVAVKRGRRQLSF
eukprot:scaffold933_cov190-Alexandrium_tamarense.AAC.2